MGGGEDAEVIVVIVVALVLTDFEVDAEEVVEVLALMLCRDFDSLGFGSGLSLELTDELEAGGVGNAEDVERGIISHVGSTRRGRNGLASYISSILSVGDASSKCD
jgi:hypothetical protein